MTTPAELRLPALESSGEEEAVAISVIVPVTERPESLAELYHEYAAPLRELGRPFEFVFAVEPWAYAMSLPLLDLARAGEPIRVLEVGQSAGETTLLRLAALDSRGSIVVTLPAYRRVEAAAIPDLIARVEQGADVAIARRWPRRDAWINRVQTRAFHLFIGRLVGRRFHDVACGVRAIRRGVMDRLPLYGDFFRFLPLFAIREGYSVEEVASAQHQRDVNVRVYQPGVYVRRLLDLLGLLFLLRFTDKPLRFFGLVGSGLSLAGSAILLVLFVQKLAGQGIADRPILLLGALLVVLGFQAIALGLIGEIIVYLHAPSRRPYRLARRSNPGLRG